MNHYGERNYIINKGLVKTECSRCAEYEDWHYIIRCKVILEERKQFVKELYDKLQKVNIEGTFKNEILRMLNDIVQYFKGTTNYQTT